MIELEVAKLSVIYARITIMLDRVFIAAETKGWVYANGNLIGYLKREAKFIRNKWNYLTKKLMHGRTKL